MIGAYIEKSGGSRDWPLLACSRRGGTEALAASAAAGVGLAIITNEAMQQGGPSSRRSLRTLTRRIVRATASDQLPAGPELKQVYQALDRGLARVFPDPQLLVVWASDKRGFAARATDETLHLLSREEPLFARSGVSTDFARSVIHHALTEAFHNPRHFEHLEPHLWEQALQQVSQIRRGVKTANQKLDTLIERSQRSISPSGVDPAVAKLILQDLAGTALDVEALQGPLIDYTIGMKMRELREVIHTLSVPSVGEGLIDTLRRRASEEIELGRLGSASDLLREAGNRAEAAIPTETNRHLAERWLEAAKLERVRLRYVASIRHFERARPHLAALDPIRRWTAVIEHSNSVYWSTFHDNVGGSIDHDELMRLHSADAEAANEIISETRATLSRDDRAAFNMLFSIVQADHQVERYLHGAAGLLSRDRRVSITAVEVALDQLCAAYTHVLGEQQKINVFGMEFPLGRPEQYLAGQLQLEFASRVILRMAHVLRLLIEHLGDIRMRMEPKPFWIADGDSVRRWRDAWMKRIDVIAERADDLVTEDLQPGSALRESMERLVEDYQLEWE